MKKIKRSMTKILWLEVPNPLKLIHKQMIHHYRHDYIISVLKGRICDFSSWPFNKNSCLISFYISFLYVRMLYFFIELPLVFLSNFNSCRIFCSIPIRCVFLFFSSVFMTIGFFYLLITWFVQVALLMI
jgi:hypothetical protein